MRYAQLVMGPAGSGKSTYCSVIQRYAADSQKVIDIVNLDPAAEYFNYEPLVDIRELINLDDAMEDDELRFGPNGGLVFCMEYIVENANWLAEKLDGMNDDYILFDCPGQLELYSHMTIMRKLITMLQKLDFQICGIFLIDSQFMIDASKFLAGTMAALSVMANLEITHINILTKIDLLPKKARKKLEKYLEPDTYSLLADMEEDPISKKYRNLTEALAKVIEDYSLVRFLPLNIKKEESIMDIKLTIDEALQYGIDLEIKTKDYEIGSGIDVADE